MELAVASEEGGNETKLPVCSVDTLGSGAASGEERDTDPSGGGVLPAMDGERPVDTALLHPTAAELIAGEAENIERSNDQQPNQQQCPVFAAVADPQPVVNSPRLTDVPLPQSGSPALCLSNARTGWGGTSRCLPVDSQTDPAAGFWSANQQGVYGRIYNRHHDPEQSSLLVDNTEEGEHFFHQFQQKQQVPFSSAAISAAASQVVGLRENVAYIGASPPVGGPVVDNHVRGTIREFGISPREAPRRQQRQYGAPLGARHHMGGPNPSEARQHLHYAAPFASFGGTFDSTIPAASAFAGPKETRQHNFQQQQQQQQLYGCDPQHFHAARQSHHAFPPSQQQELSSHAQQHRVFDGGDQGTAARRFFNNSLPNQLPAIRYRPRPFNDEVHLQFRGVGDNLTHLDVHCDGTKTSRFIDGSPLPGTIHQNFSRLQSPNFEISVYSDIGGRKFQEDRFTVAPQLIEARDDSLFLGVFDGTVGDFASENVKDLVIPALCGSESWQRMLKLFKQRNVTTEEDLAAVNLFCEASKEPPAPGTTATASDIPVAADGAVAVDTDSADSAADLTRVNREADNVDESEAVSNVVNGDDENSVGGQQTAAAADILNSPSEEVSSGSRHVATVIATTENDAKDEGCAQQTTDAGGGTEDGDDNTAEEEEEFYSDCNLSSESGQEESAQKEAGASIDDEISQLLMDSMAIMYLKSDSDLVDLCAQESRHFASSTSVTAIVAAGQCCVGHLGDSRAALGFLTPNNSLRAEFLTIDHKPDLKHEHDRIVSRGGSVEYLHNHENKPFIRGGDFTERKAKGEQVMQLQYSRAFGGKDLKMFGLSNEPDLRCFKIKPGNHVCLILASDGLWDVYTAQAAVEIAVASYQSGKDPAEMLVRATVNHQAERQGKCDNVTAMVLFFR